MTLMRAKLRINRIEKFERSEKLHFNAVGKSSYPGDGSDENNTYASYTPSANFEIHITNPALLGRFNVGETFYLDFTRAPE